MKVLAFLLSVMNSSVSGLILISCMSKYNLHWAALEHISGRLLTGSLVILIGLLTILDGLRPLRPEKLLVAGLLLFLLGATCTLWGLHLTLLSGDLKKAFILYGGSLAIQGIATIWGAYETREIVNT